MVPKSLFEPSLDVKAFRADVSDPDGAGIRAGKRRKLENGLHDWYASGENEGDGLQGCLEGDGGAEDELPML
jgi:hypothetical protein